MWEKVIVYMNFADCFDQIEEKNTFLKKVILKNKKQENKTSDHCPLKKHHQEQMNKHLKDDYLFYREMVENILREYSDEIEVENQWEFFLDLSQTQYLFSTDPLITVQDIVSKVFDEWGLHVRAAVSFQKDFAKWVYRISKHLPISSLSYQQACRLFQKKNIEDYLEKSFQQDYNQEKALPSFIAQENGQPFSNYQEAVTVADCLSQRLIYQLKEKDYAMKEIQICFYDSQDHFYKLKKCLRNFTNVAGEIRSFIHDILKCFQYTDIYFGMKILLVHLSDLRNYLPKPQSNKESIKNISWNDVFSLRCIHIFPKNHSYFLKRAKSS